MVIKEKIKSVWRSLLVQDQMFYLTTHSTHFIYGYMASDIWLRTILTVRKETRCRHIGYSYQLTARVLLYAPSHRQDNTYHSLCYTSRGALAGMRNSSMGPPHEGSIRRPTTPWANALPLSYVPLLRFTYLHSGFDLFDEMSYHRLCDHLQQPLPSLGKLNQKPPRLVRIWSCAHILYHVFHQRPLEWRNLQF